MGKRRFLILMMFVLTLIAFTFVLSSCAGRSVPENDEEPFVEEIKAEPPPPPKPVIETAEQKVRLLYESIMSCPCCYSNVVSEPGKGKIVLFYYEDALFQPKMNTLEAPECITTLAKLLQKKKVTIEVLGFSDAKDGVYGFRLSHERAEVIATLLVNTGVEARFAGQGAISPISKEANENRRVEIVVRLK